MRHAKAADVAKSTHNNSPMIPSKEPWSGWDRMGEGARGMRNAFHLAAQLFRHRRDRKMRPAGLAVAAAAAAERKRKLCQLKMKKTSCPKTFTGFSS